MLRAYVVGDKLRIERASAKTGEIWKSLQVIDAEEAEYLIVQLQAYVEGLRFCQSLKGLS